MKILGALPLLAMLVACAGPAPEPMGEAAVVEPSMVVCRTGHDGGAVVAERGIGGTGAPAQTRLADRGIGGTGIVGVVTGFASICIDGLDVQVDKSVPVSVNGEPATIRQLRVGQLAVIDASGPAMRQDSVVEARMISVRYEVSGPIEAVDSKADAMTVAGQRVMVLPSTWVAGHFGSGDWVTVSGLRQPDGTIVASRLDRARVGDLMVRGRLDRQQATTRIGSLVLRGSVAAAVQSGAVVAIEGKYQNGGADVTAIRADLLSQDPISYFGDSARQVIIQALVRVEGGTVQFSTGQSFPAGRAVNGQGSGYRNAIVWMERAADGTYSASQVYYTNFRAQAGEAPAKVRRPGSGGLILPPDPPPGAPADTPAGATGTDGNPAPDAPTGDAPTSNAVPSPAEPATEGAVIADRRPASSP